MDRLLRDIIHLAKQAAVQILAIYQNPMAVSWKPDQSPLTQADLISDRIIREGLKRLTPDLPLLSEECAGLSFQERQRWSRYWLLDPLDGTREFIAKNDEFTINIALIEHHQPILGVIYAPALQLCYFARKGQGAFKQVANNEWPIHSQPWKPGTPLQVTTSRQHHKLFYKQFLSHFDPVTIVPCGSALKFARVAEAAVNIYPRLTPTSEWDTAAGQCILSEAGGRVIDRTGQALAYNRRPSLQNEPFLAVSDKSHHWFFSAQGLHL